MIAKPSVTYGPPVFRIKEGATLPAIDFQTKDLDENVVPLLDAVSVSFVFRKRKARSSDLPQTRVASFRTRDNGEVRYEWAPSDTVEPGDYFAEWRVTFSSGKERIFPERGYQPFTIESAL